MKLMISSFLIIPSLLASATSMAAGPVYNFNFYNADNNGTNAVVPKEQGSKAQVIPVNNTETKSSLPVSAPNIIQQKSNSRPGFFDRYNDSRNALELSYFQNDYASHSYTEWDTSWNETTDSWDNGPIEDLVPQMISSKGLGLSYNIPLDAGLSLTPGLTIQGVVVSSGVLSVVSYEGQLPGASLDLKYETPAAFYDVLGIQAGVSGKYVKGTLTNDVKLELTHLGGELFVGPKFKFGDTLVSAKFFAGHTKDKMLLNGTRYNPGGQSYKGGAVTLSFKI